MIAFYERGLGMTVEKEWDRGRDDRGVLLKFDGPTGATVIEVYTGSAPPTAEHLAPTGISVGIRVDDVETFAAELRERGIGVSLELEETPWGHRSFDVTDPDGLVIVVFQDIGSRQ